MTYPPLDEPWQERRAAIYGRANQASSHYRSPRPDQPGHDQAMPMAQKSANRRRFWLFTVALLVALAFGTAMFGIVFAAPAPVAQAPADPPAVRPQQSEPAVPPPPTGTSDPPTGPEREDPAPPKTTPPPAGAGAAAPAPAPKQPAATETVYFKNCAKARKAGAAPLYRGDPGYSAALDKDGDGVACEKGKA